MAKMEHIAQLTAFNKAIFSLKQNNMPAPSCYKDCVTYTVGENHYTVYLVDDNSFRVAWNFDDNCSISSRQTGKMDYLKLVEFLEEHGGYGKMTKIKFVEFHVEWNRVDSRWTNTSGKLSEAKLVEFIVEHGGYGVMEDVTFVAAKTLYRSPYGLVPIG